ncbi:endonuclease/exonuclease/phosphatase family protein [Longibacter salinarum]|nr:endonuclease/exonuclease/phosphatase family protein [Longibacter salinarum]
MTPFARATNWSPLPFIGLVLLIAATVSGCSGVFSTTDSPSGTANIPGVATVPPGYDFPADDSLTVATWNVENFVDEYDNPYIDNEWENSPPDDMYARFKLFIRGVRALDADIVVLQEIESEAFAQSIAEEHLSDMGYQFFTATESPDWFQNVVLMSRVPLGVVESYSDVVTPIEGITTDEGEPAAQSLTNNRIWRATVHARPDYTVHLVGAHLKAGRDDRDRGWRVGQVRLLHERFNDLLATTPDANILVAGDLNSLSDSPELRLLLNDSDRPAPGSMQQDTGEWNATFIDPLHGRPTFTHPSDNPERQLDYILINENTQPELVPGSARVARPLSDAELARFSDHLPVVVTLLTTE